MPEFRRLGLRLEGHEVVTDAAWGYDDAAAEIFGITQRDAFDLFTPGSDREERLTPKQVAKRIEKFAAGL